MTDNSLPPLDKQAFETLANFRYEVRKFLRFSEKVTRKAGITPLQYLMLLNIKGYPGRDWATVGELAERLQAQHHGVVALVSRCEKQGFVERRRSEEDRRRIEVHLLPKGDAIVERLANAHRVQLMSLDGRFAVPTRSAFVRS
ncbi:MAG: MarR family winged helix-turn-helix transcriptional regulator [Rhodocyclaceae bacterium]|nr:MarR family winged helix-turn-helix transcriptional regulator [Rhodocyclaceae bacterium]